MQNIRLVRDGIFPITKNKDGKIINTLPETGLSIPGTLQGEGKLLGTPVLFIRTAGCNLRCIWTLANGKPSICDTPYSSFDTKDSEVYSINNIIEIVKNNIGNLQHIVISGGEPMLQKDALINLCTELKNQLNVHITIETNGTIFINELLEFVDLFSLSPKLSNSNPTNEKLEQLNLTSLSKYILIHQQKRLNINAIQQFINAGNSMKNIDFQLKFVVSSINDEKEILEILSNLTGWQNNDILLMQTGVTNSELALSTNAILEMTLRNGWRFTPRLHIEMFGNKRSV